MKELAMNHGKGKMQQERYGAVVVSRYIGQFHTERLQSKANTGLWYSRVMGNPHAIQGEGSTPILAIIDSIERTKNQRTKLLQAVRTLQSSIELAKEPS